MRHLLLLFALLSTSLLAAQVYTQSEAPVQQMKMPADCYTTNLDKGNAALRRGDAKEALRYFKAARSCDEVQSNSRRLSELDSRILRTEEQLGIRNESNKIAEAVKAPVVQGTNNGRKYTNEIPVTRKNYKASSNLQKDTLDDCFLRMTEEADRAFRLKFWEDAASLYRAAKNCADADQAGRQLMSEKIVQCRNAAENELFAKQQEAERQARHAIAANLADDAQELLENADRSLAFRLADFANQYVAPDDNPDCVQAIFDAWYYQPSKPEVHKSDQLFNPVFCYEITDYFGNAVQLKFQENRSGKTQLWTYIPENGEINVREMPEMQTVQTLLTGEDAAYYAFDVSIQSDVLLVGKNYMELHRGSKQHRINTANVVNWSFSPRGDELAFEDPKELKIYLLPVNQVFNQMASRKNAKSANIMVQPVEPREMVSGIAPGLLDLQYYDGKFWLGYSDRIEILSKPEPGKPWKKETAWHQNLNLPESFEQKHLNLEIYPQEGFSLLVYFNQTWILPIVSPSVPDPLTTANRQYQELVPLAVSPETHQMFCRDTLNLHDGIWILDVKTGDTITHQHMPASAFYYSMKGTYSPDGAWVAAANEGSINIWSLREAPTKSNRAMPVVPGDKPLITPDGAMLVAQHEDTVSVMNLPDLDVIHSWKSLGTPLKGISNHWALIQVSTDSVEARHFTANKKIRLPLFNPDAFPYLYTFDSKGEKWVAYNTAWDKVEVRNLQTGALVASRKFEGGNISELHFIPGKDQLLVVLNAETGYSSVKLWSPLEPTKNPRTMRLHLYSVNTLAIEPNGKRIALSDENDIRIFDLQNIENEALKIRSNKSGFINCLAFRPNSDLLAAAYADGKVIFWNATNGQSALQLQAIEQQTEWNGSTVPTALGFAQEGNELILTIANGHLLTYVLDPSYIRTVVQNEYRQLQPLTLDQIQEYNLESALYYPGNFERLATSNDGPLIRSFFQHFGNQALGSNNIDQVRDYCDKSLFLYERLNAKVQERWVNEMVYIYRDYAWKLLLRGNIKESNAVINFIQKKFKKESLLLTAHTALLQDDCLGAGRHYTQHFLGDGSGLQDNYSIRNEMDQAERELIQLRDFGLVDTAQLECFCNAMRLSGGFANLCTAETIQPNALSESDLLRWDIFKKTQEAIYTFAYAPKQKLLEEAVIQARKLYTLRPELGGGWLESTTLELAKTFHLRAGFEQNNPVANDYFEACRRLLTESGSFKSALDTTRLSLLATNHLAYGRQLLNAGKYQEAIEQFNGGIKAMNALWPIVYATDSMLIIGYSDNVVGPLYEKLGTAYLFTGDTAAARQSYEKAGIYMLSYGLNTLYMGGLRILQGDEIQALADYGGIFNANQTGEALFMLEQLSRLFPERREMVSSLKEQLISALQARNPRLVNAEADYWFAVRMQLHFAAQMRWDSTLYWSRQMQKTAKSCMEMPKAENAWTYNWLDAQISVAYYLLLAEWKKQESLNEVIQISNTIERFLEAHTDLYYLNLELVKTNVAHALILRNQPGDREKALQLYEKFLQSYGSMQGYDNIDLLEKDIRDLKSVGAPWPELPPFQQMLDNQR